MENAVKTDLPESIEDTETLLHSGGYVPDRPLAIAVFLSLKLGRPLFLEGEAGVGKTEIAKVLSASLGRKLIRLQCYEGLDVASAVYEWNYPRQMMAIRLAESGGESNMSEVSENIYGAEYLIERPLLSALRPDNGGPPVLLIDELDRTDEPFEAFLLEVLSEYQVTIPELGTVAASESPIVIITSNRTREIHDALKRRCLYHWVDYPDADREYEILRNKVPEAADSLSLQVVAAAQHLRGADLFKPPGVAETIDWVRALIALDRGYLDRDGLEETLGVVLKYRDDINHVRENTIDGTIAAASAAL
ncbi:MAG: MoxR family ATPase [Rhodospirillaceae bacterium]|jgi:MoxR-like ATPase|nr:MoxR family ATPase [Rhodospirillaceae bacterium]